MCICFKKLIIILVLSALIAPYSVSVAETAGPQEDDAEKAAYTVQIEGLPTPSLEKELRSHLFLIKLQHSPRVSELVLKKRIQKDQEVIKRFFAAKGYFETTQSMTLQKDPHIIHLKIDPGPQYRIGGWIFRIKDDHTRNNPLPLPDLKKNKVNKGRSVKLQNILDFKDLILKNLSEKGYPFAKISHLQGVVHPKTKTLTLYVDLHPGQYTTFGPTHVEPLKNLDSTYVHNRLQWQEGEPFNSVKLEETRALLMETRLFNDLDMTYNEAKTHNGKTPVEIHAKEAKPRTVSLGAQYSTSERLGARASWHHRNAFGHGELFKSDLDYGSLESSGDFDLSLPDFFGYQRALLFNGSLKRKKTKSYTVVSAHLGVGFEQIINKRHKFFEGLNLVTETSKEKTRTLRSRLVTLPLGYHYDSTDDLLNPKQGERLHLSMTPGFGKLGRYNSIVTTKIYGSSYWSLDENRHNILAGWIRLGNLFGPPLESIPANMRLYAGGNSSVRGYGYQMLGPLDAEGIPTGGKTSLELGVEYRALIKKDWGATLFLEGGKVAARHQPSDFLFGAGMGVRYETRFGVLRFDVAFPFKRRKNASQKTVDAPFQIYASIGQAF